MIVLLAFTLEYLAHRPTELHLIKPDEASCHRFSRVFFPSPRTPRLHPSTRSVVLSQIPPPTRMSPSTCRPPQATRTGRQGPAAGVRARQTGQTRVTDGGKRVGDPRVSEWEGLSAIKLLSVTKHARKSANTTGCVRKSWLREQREAQASISDKKHLER